MVWKSIPHNKELIIPPELAGRIRDPNDFRKKYVPPERTHKDISEMAEKIREEVCPPNQKDLNTQLLVDQAPKPLEPKPPRSRETSDLYDAIQLAEMFEANMTKDGNGYIIEEGWDLHLLIHSIVVFHRAYKRMRETLKSRTDTSTECMDGPVLPAPHVLTPAQPRVPSTIKIEEQSRLQCNVDCKKSGFLL